jgi:N-acetylmuramic acid 6-phosphate etherase
VNQTGTPLAAGADVAVVLEVGPEVLRGSTRLGAGTAQKLALNALTTTAMVRLGRVHGDLMVDVEPVNSKLRERAAGIVAEIAGCSAEAAAAALDACQGNTRAAVVHLVLGLPPADAADRAAQFITLRDSLGQNP